MSAVWGGGTLGLIIGLILGFFVPADYWTFVFYCVIVGAAFGVATNILAFVGALIKGKR